MTAELWRQTDSTLALHVDAEHKREIRNIKRSRNWELILKHEKNGKIYAYQWRVHNSDYQSAHRIVKRINEGDRESAE